MALRHSLFRRKDTGRWILSLDVNGNWKNPRQVTAPREIGSQKAATAWCQVQLATIEANDGQLPQPAVSGPTVAEIAKKAVAIRKQHPNIRASTVKNYNTHINGQIIPAIGAEPFNKIGISDARAFVRNLRAKVSANHCRNVTATARMIWDVARGEEWTKLPNPWREEALKKELPKARNKSSDPIAFAIDVAQRLIEDADLPEVRRVRYALAFTSGLSDGEIAGLQWSDAYLDSSPPYVRVRQALAIIGEDGFASISDPKTDNRKREVPLHPAAAEALFFWRRDGWGRLVTRLPKPTDFVFVKANGKEWRPRSARYVRADLETIEAPTTTLGGHPFTFQAMRRTFSTMLRDAGVSLETRGRLLGHSGKTVTERNYTAKELTLAAEAVALIPIQWRTVKRTVRTENGATQRTEESVMITEAWRRVELPYDGFAKVRHLCGQAPADGDGSHLVDHSQSYGNGQDDGNGNAHRGPGLHRTKDGGLARTLRNAVRLALERDETATLYALRKAMRMLGHGPRKAKTKRSDGGAR